MIEEAYKHYMIFDEEISPLLDRIKDSLHKEVNCPRCSHAYKIPVYAEKKDIEIVNVLLAGIKEFIVETGMTKFYRDKFKEMLFEIECEIKDELGD